jgi:ubiquitin carboxyl-terminal hydrolase 7
VKSAGGCITAKEFYDHLLNLITIKFSPRPGQNNLWPRFDLELNKKISYDQFAAKVGKYLKTDPTHIKFMTINTTNGSIKALVNPNRVHSLQYIMSPPYSTFGNVGQRTDELYYEVIEPSLLEVDMKNLKVIEQREEISKEG